MSFDTVEVRSSSLPVPTIFSIGIERIPNILQPGTFSIYFPVRESHTGLPFSSRNKSVSVPLTSSRARITSEASCLTFEPVTAISSPLPKLMPPLLEMFSGTRISEPYRLHS